jgi:hypothetical protein
MRIKLIHDQLATVGETIPDAELENVSLNGFPNAWNHSSWAYIPERNVPSGRDFGMTAFRRRLVESPDMANRYEVQLMIT